MYALCFPQGEGAWAAVPVGNPQPTVPAAVLAEQARGSFRLELPKAATNPAGQTLVNLPTFLYVDDSDWRTRTAVAEVAGTRVTVAATPTSTTWDMGERRAEGSASVTCQGPGKPFDPAGPSGQQPECGYRYRQTSARQLGSSQPGFTVRATVVWEVSWRCTGICDEQRGTLDPLTPSTTLRLPVYQARSELVQPR